MNLKASDQVQFFKGSRTRLCTMGTACLVGHGLLEAWFELTSVKYYGNLYNLIPLNQRLALTRLRATGPWSLTEFSLLFPLFRIRSLLSYPCMD